VHKLFFQKNYILTPSFPLLEINNYQLSRPASLLSGLLSTSKRSKSSDLLNEFDYIQLVP